MSVITAQSIKGYELLDLIGEGAYGAVYRAHQPLVGRTVAIKIILPQYANQPEFIRRFENEAQLVAQLEHLHIVPLYDYWRDPEGAYLVMRLMKGGSLEVSNKEAGPWNQEDAARLVDQVASALDSAHQQGVVHRDLKPANILLDEDGNAYLSDFGIAKELGAAADITQTEAILGTPAYISPEQVQNQPVTPQTDIYSFGVLLYGLLVGKHPSPDTSTAELVIKHLQEPLPYVRESHPELPAALDGVIQRATAKNPIDRYTTALALAIDFHRALQLEVDLPEVPESELYNPYKGLRAFQESDSDDFFGRESLTGQLLAQLAAPGDGGRFLAVVGPSGSGKSSVVKAGLLPALRKGALPGSDKWFISETHPGSHPLKELQLALLSITADPDVNLGEMLKQGNNGLLNAARFALPSKDSELLLVIDQFEELFIIGEDEDERELFLESLHCAVTDPESHIRVVVTLRADFYDRPLMHPDFGRLVEERTAVVLPLSSEELEQAIQRPAERVGAVLEKGLVSEIISDVAAQPGALPLLQFALTELFERREGRMLTNQAYQTIGGVLGALGRRAEEVYSGLDLIGKDAVQQLFLRLVTLGEGAEDTRRRVLKSELDSIAFLPSRRGDWGEGNINTVIDVFGKARLLTFDHDPVTRGSTVEVAHEALLGEWRRLSSWLDNSRVDIRMQRLLGEAALEWQGINRDSGYLLRGSRLDQFEAWAATTDIAFTQVEREYLEASLEDRRLREAEEEQRLARETAMERRSRNFLRGLVAVLAVATVVAVVLTIFAFNQRGDAQNSAATAQAEALARATQQSIAESEADQRATQQAIAEGEASARATAEAIAVEQRDEVLRQVSVALAGQALEQKNLGKPELAVLLTMAALEEYPYTPQAEKTLSESVIAVSSWRLSPEGGNVGWSAVAWSPKGDRIATALYGGTLPTGSQILIQDARSGSEIRRFELDVDCSLASNVIWSPSGDRLIAIPQYCDYAPRIWDAMTGELIAILASEPDQANFSASWSPDGNSLVTGSRDGIARIWVANTGDKLREIKAHDNYITQVAWSPTGEQLATASNDDTAKIWDAATGGLLYVLSGYGDDVAGVTWSPDGKYISVASLDSNALVWDVISGESLISLAGHRDQVWDVAWSPNGKYIATDSRDGTTRIWDAGNGKQSFEFQNNLEEQLVLNSIDWSPGGDRLLMMGVEFNQIWDLTAQPPRLSGHTRGLNAAEWSPNGRYIATGSLDSTARIWDAASGELLADLEHPGVVEDIAWSPGSSQIATTSQGGYIGVWEIASGTFSQLPNSDGYIFHHLAWSPDGSRIVATSETDFVGVIWEVSTDIRTVLQQEDLRCILTTPSWSPAGDSLVTGCERREARDTPARIWDVETGEELQRLNSEDGKSLVVEWSPDGTSIAVGYSNTDIRIWDVGSDRPKSKFSAHADLIVDLNWSPNSQRIVSADYGGNIRVWDAQTGEEVLSKKTPNTINSISWSPEGEYMISATFDPMPEIYRAWQTTEALVKYAEGCCVWHELSKGERERFGLP
jgi:WD40 repeat protein/serine/threonine protein kinase